MSRDPLWDAALFLGASVRVTVRVQGERAYHVPTYGQIAITPGSRAVLRRSLIAQAVPTEDATRVARRLLAIICRKR